MPFGENQNSLERWLDTLYESEYVRNAGMAKAPFKIESIDLCHGTAALLKFDQTH